MIKWDSLLSCSVGTSPGEDDMILGMKQTPNSYIFENLSRQWNNDPVSVKAFDQAQNASEVVSSNGIVSDQEVLYQAML